MNTMQGTVTVGGSSFSYRALPTNTSPFVSDGPQTINFDVAIDPATTDQNVLDAIYSDLKRLALFRDTI